jgi:hypothetical protein
MKEADWNPQEVQKEEEKRSEKHKVINEEKVLRLDQNR